MPERLVTVASYGAGGSSARVRVLDWLAHVGIDAENHRYAGTADNRPSTLLRSPSRTLSAEADLRRLTGRVSSRTVLLSRRASPFSSGRLEERLLSSAHRGVYDVDDALYADTGGLMRQVWPPPAVWRRAVAAADVVIAGNETLAERAAADGGNVVVIPSCVEPDAYRQKTDFGLGDVPRAVWIGSPSTEWHLSLVAQSLLSVHRSHRMRLTVVSRGSASLGALDTMVDRVQWDPLTYGEVLAACDLGIMPLYDSAFSRGKCGYKLLQYAAAAIPVVGSPVGANAAVLAELGGDAPDNGEWADAVVSLLDAPAETRKRRGQAARAAVEKSYSFAAWESRWRAAVGL